LEIVDLIWFSNLLLRESVKQGNGLCCEGCTLW